MPVVAVAFSAVEFRLSVRWEAVLAAAAMATLAFCAAGAGGNWAYYDRQYAEFRGALQASPAGTKIMTVLDGDAMGLASDQPYWHMAEYAIADKGAMTALLFATKGQHVVQVNPPYDRYVATTAQQGSPPDIGELDDLAAGKADGDPDIDNVFPYLKYFPCHYDEVVVVRVSDKTEPAPDMLRLRHAGSFFSLYDIVPYDTLPRACAR